jgi:hypothetical protein
VCIRAVSQDTIDVGMDRRRDRVSYARIGIVLREPKKELTVAIRLQKRSSPDGRVRIPDCSTRMSFWNSCGQGAVLSEPVSGTEIPCVVG